MPVRRLVVFGSHAAGEVALISGPPFHHLIHVLRLGAGDPVLLVDSTGQRHEGRLLSVSRREAKVAIERSFPPPPDPAVHLTLVYGLSRGHRTEWVLQKAVELGVDTIGLALCERSVARPAPDPRKLRRWQEIVFQAARQSRRGRLPTLLPPRPIGEALAQCSLARLRLLASPGGLPLSRVGGLRGPLPDQVALAVGPEGGFSEREIARARDLGFVVVGLGPLVLRTETAAITLVSIVAFFSGKLEEQ